MLNYRATAFEELVRPLSQGKVLLLLKVTDPDQCDQIDYFQAFLHGIGAKDGSGLLEEFLAQGYLAAETGLSEAGRQAGELVIDYFRQQRFQAVLSAYLFVDAQLVAHSGDGVASTRDILAELDRAGQPGVGLS